MSKITNDCLTRSGNNRMLHSCTHMATVGVKGLIAAPIHKSRDKEAVTWPTCCSANEVRHNVNRPAVTVSGSLGARTASTQTQTRRNYSTRQQFRDQC